MTTNEFLCSNISMLRKKHSLSQMALAKKLGLTFQAVSKWENNLSCPDLSLIPVIADIFNVSIDYLFKNTPDTPYEEPHNANACDVAFANQHSGNSVEVDWADDDTIHAVLFKGHSLLKAQEVSDDFAPLQFEYTGPASNIISTLNVTVKSDNMKNCNIHAGVTINCGNIVNSNVSSGTSLNSGDIYAKTLRAGVSINASDITCQHINAGVSIHCSTLNTENVNLSKLKQAADANLLTESEDDSSSCNEYTLDDLSYEAGDLKEEIEDLKSEMTDLKEEIEDLKSEMTDLNDSLNDFKCNETDLNTRLNELLNNKNNIQIDINALKDRLAKATSKISYDDVSDSLEEINNITDELSDKNEDLEDITDEINDVLEEINDNKTEMEDLQNEINDMQSEIDCKISEFNAIKASIMSLTSK